MIIKIYDCNSKIVKVVVVCIYLCNTKKCICTLQTKTYTALYVAVVEVNSSLKLFNFSWKMIIHLKKRSSRYNRCSSITSINKRMK